VLALSGLSTLDESLDLPGSGSTERVGKLEGPKEVVDLLEVRSSLTDLVDDVLDGEDTVFAKVLFNDLVRRKSNSLLVDLSVSTLVDEFSDGLQVGLTVSDVGLNSEKHLRSSLGDLDEDTVVDLEKTEELKDLARLRGNVVDTLDTHDEVNLGLSGDVEVSVSLGLPLQADLLSLLLLVVVDVLLGALEDDSALGLASLAGIEGSSLLLLTGLLSRLALLEKGLGNENVLLRRGGRARHGWRRDAFLSGQDIQRDPPTVFLLNL